MYFATLTEVPILPGLLGSGMGQGARTAFSRAFVMPYSGDKGTGIKENRHLCGFSGVSFYCRRMGFGALLA